MEKFRITREIAIDAGHRIPDHKSKCCNLHGHRYVIQATCEGELVEEGEQKGMVLDFAFLKEEMMTEIDTPCDHGLMLSWDDPLIAVLVPDIHRTLGCNDKKRVWSGHRPPAGKLYLVPFTPTAENLAQHWFSRLSKKVLIRSMERAILTVVRVLETPNCWAEYPAVPTLQRRDHG